ncbi:hypothetical protein QR680_004927 [Steinernema hermaphroditum]|uniref:Uncharacterized protein n=1 Tax=Steinernema hermaphroditum TaxID=289476 RepID=A0AA39LUH0_9BILA|nr:hypothetical protein QR680_004927 [Steinernema hermaphroditum]
MESSKNLAKLIVKTASKGDNPDLLHKLCTLLEGSDLSNAEVRDYLWWLGPCMDKRVRQTAAFLEAMLPEYVDEDGEECSYAEFSGNRFSENAEVCIAWTIIVGSLAFLVYALLF